MTYYLGVDIGTTSTKSVLFGEKGKVISMHHAGYPLYSPSPQVAEQHPDEIFRAVIDSMKTAIAKSGVDPSEIKLVSFSSAMHTLIAVDKGGKPLTNCITWADARGKMGEKIKDEWHGHSALKFAKDRRFNWPWTRGKRWYPAHKKGCPFSCLKGAAFFNIAPDRGQKCAFPAPARNRFKRNIPIRLVSGTVLVLSFLPQPGKIDF